MSSILITSFEERCDFRSVSTRKINRRLHRRWVDQHNWEKKVSGLSHWFFVVCEWNNKPSILRYKQHFSFHTLPVHVCFISTSIHLKMFTCVFCLWEPGFSLWIGDDFGSPENSKPTQAFIPVRDKALPVGRTPMEQICNVACGFCSGNQIALSHGVGLQES